MIRRVGIMRQGRLIKIGRPGVLNAELDAQLRLDIVFAPDRLPPIINTLSQPDRLPLALDIAVLLAITIAFFWLVTKRLDWRARR